MSEAEQIAKLREALRDALDGWAEAASYKGEWLSKHHGDFEDIERLRAILAATDK